MSKRYATAKVWSDEAGQKAIRDTETGTRITMIASTPSMDRDEQKIDSEGWHWPENTLPKLLWGHDYRGADSVIGKLVRVWKEPGRLMIEAELADKVGGHEKAELVAKLMKGGFLDQGSVGFIPDEWEHADGSKGSKESGVSGPIARFTKQELIEFSITAVPSLRDSMTVGMRSLFEEAPAPEPQQTAAIPRIEIKDSDEFKDWFAKLFGPREKAGRVLSRANQDKLVNAKDAMSAAVSAIEDVIRSAERADETEVEDPAR